MSNEKKPHRKNAMVTASLPANLGLPNGESFVGHPYTEFFQNNSSHNSLSSGSGNSQELGEVEDGPKERQRRAAIVKNNTTDLAQHRKSIEALRAAPNISRGSSRKNSTDSSEKEDTFSTNTVARNNIVSRQKKASTIDGEGELTVTVTDDLRNLFQSQRRDAIGRVDTNTYSASLTNNGGYGLLNGNRPGTPDLSKGILNSDGEILPTTDFIQNKIDEGNITTKRKIVERMFSRGANMNTTDGQTSHVEALKNQAKQNPPPATTNVSTTEQKVTYSETKGGCCITM